MITDLHLSKVVDYALLLFLRGELTVHTLAAPTPDGTLFCSAGQ